jgi:hypothetical protein
MNQGWKTAQERVSCPVGQSRMRIGGKSDAPPRRELDPRYLGFFDCFNRQHFFEAHEVLENLWLTERGGPRDQFFRGLIQIAGAFVHLQKGRLAPAASLFRLAQANLRPYSPVFERLEMAHVHQLIDECLESLELNSCPNNHLSSNRPRLWLNTQACSPTAQ